jgi:hypothetical protein
MGGMFSSSSKSSSKDDDDEDEDDYIKEQKRNSCRDDCKRKYGSSIEDNKPLFSGGKKRKSAFRKSLIKAKSKGKATRKRLK